MPYFSPKTVAGLEDKIRGWAVHFIDAIKDDGRTELVKSISSRFPVTIFMEMMGIPFEKFDLFRTLAEDFFSESTEQRRHEISDTIYREMVALIDARAVARTDDLMQILVDSQIEGRPIARDELKSMALLLFLAGLDTLVNVISFSYRELAKRPDLQDRLRKDPSKIPAFVEEGLRMFGVVNVPRIVLKDTTRHGVTFKEGDMVLALISQFGRDPRENPNPTVMDLDRENRRLMPFSTGPHLCLGHHLTRTEMRILTEEWLKRIPHFAIADGYEPSYRAGLVMALKSLSLTWDVSANRALDIAAE